MKVITMLLTSVLALAAGPCTGSKFDEQQTAQRKEATSEATTPIVDIQVSPISKLGKPLIVRWKISNVGVQPVYIYSTLLEHQSFAEVNIDAEQKLIELRFLRLKLWGDGPPPYYFPKTEFIRIDRGQAQEGRFVSDGPVGQVVSYKTVNQRTEQKVNIGTWSIRALIAYGYNVDSVQQAVDELESRGKGLPADPVVKWQKVAYSASSNVIFEK